MKQQQTRIALTGGGSGGHIYPLLAVAEALQKKAAEKATYIEFRYFGPPDNYKSLLENSGLKFSSVTAGKIRRYFSLLNLLDVPKFFIGLAQAFFKMFWFMPDAVFSKGGSGAFPVVLAAWFYRIPVMLHESDAQPGLNNLLSAPFAKRIAVSFERAQNYFNSKKTTVVGTPVRSFLLKERLTKEQAKEELGFLSVQPLVFVLGGSQGSQRINNLLLLILKDLMPLTQILHQTGAANIAEVEKLSRAALLEVPLKIELKNRYQAVAYLENNLKTVLSAADLIVARAGSNTIFEIAAFAKPAILIPILESANDHQRLNAYEFAKTGAALVIEEVNLLPGIFLGQIKKLLGDQDILNKMSLASGKFFKPQAAETITEEILKISIK